MKLLVVISLLFCFSMANITDDAYSAYQKKEYQKAFNLYKKAADMGDAKGLYNLALFYEKGIGVKKDKSKAERLYEKLIHQLSDETFCSYRMQKYYSNAFKKLSKYTLLKKRESICRENRFLPMYKDAEYIKKCPYADIIPLPYRDNISQLDC